MSFRVESSTCWIGLECTLGCRVIFGEIVCKSFCSFVCLRCERVCSVLFYLGGLLLCCWSVAVLLFVSSSVKMGWL